MTIFRRDFIKLVAAVVVSPFLVNEDETNKTSIVVRAVEPKEVVEFLQKPGSKKVIEEAVSLANWKILDEAIIKAAQERLCLVADLYRLERFEL